jgi:cysteine desulfurase / selenocysteine lyase
MDPNIRDLFPAALNYTYLNSAVIGPLPLPTVSAVKSQLTDVSHHGSANFCEWLKLKERVRAMVADLLNVSPSDIAFTRNTSDGLCAVASSLKWKPGDNIVTFAGEFPANVYPWRKLPEEKGVEIRMCPEQGGRIDLDEFCALIDERTRLVSVSAVQYSSGFRADLERIGRAARAHDALFAVDIIQAFGAQPLDLSAEFVDIAVGASYKWLCSPEGCGIFYLNERAREQIIPAAYGWTAVGDRWDFCDQDQAFTADARAWETGMGGTALFYGLEQSLELLSRTGVERISAHLAELTDYLCELIPSHRWEVASSRAPGEKSQIVSLRPFNGTSAESAVEALGREKIVVSARGNRIRVAPHFFNNFDDIERFAAELP